MTSTCRITSWLETSGGWRPNLLSAAMACDSRLRALPAAHVDGPAIHYIVTRDQVEPLVVGHGRIDVRRDQPKAVADGPGWREGCVLVRAEPDMRAAKLGVAVIHAECLRPASATDHSGAMEMTLARTNTACLNG